MKEEVRSMVSDVSNILLDTMRTMSKKVSTPEDANALTSMAYALKEYLFFEKQLGDTETHLMDETDIDRISERLYELTRRE